ncbi:hypothetical protein YYG_03462 [Plasmodium vinckei petteri]|uniref:Gamma tubulin complex component protein N-terminal domain-containing protein n=1 Tax=Plasmodium vinckei petteri TaxID=138298 RepID=W7AI47_PLAVN|nr:hypothetical protein YYG_03462 [Plasmodium vinckei petteri]CAD2111504.1 conserved Plasmodium protein, unknown function [Plasmodium vinckei petteri]
MTSSYINEIKKNQKTYLSYLFSKFEKYSNEKFLNDLMNKSLNEIALYPFQDVNDNEVINDINEFINELTINAEYKKKRIFKHICETFLSDNFHIYNDKDRYELKYIILKVLFLISEKSKNDKLKEIDLIYDKYFSNNNDSKRQKESDITILNINEQKALNDINKFNIEENQKYLDELHNSYDDASQFNFSSSENDDNVDNKEGFYKCSNNYLNKENDESDYKNANVQSDEDDNFNTFNETEYNNFIGNYMKNKNELIYENVIKKISMCAYKYPHYENVKDKLRYASAHFGRNIHEMAEDEDGYCDDYHYSDDYCEDSPLRDYKPNYNKNKNIYKKNYDEKNENFQNNSDESYDEYIFTNLKKKQNKNKFYLFTSKPKEQYFFNNINFFDEEIHNNIETEQNLIYETDIYNLHNIFINEDIQQKNEDSYFKQQTSSISNEDHNSIRNISLNEQAQAKMTQIHNINENLSLDKNSDHIVKYKINGKDALLESGNQDTHCSQILIGENYINSRNTLIKGVKTAIKTPRVKKKNAFYVSEIFIIKEILMMLSFNCPIKFKGNFFTNFMDFLFDKPMDRNKIKDDFLFYIEIKKKVISNGNLGNTHQGKHRLSSDKQNNNISSEQIINSDIITYYAVISEMMKIKLYNIRRATFKNYIKNIKKISTKLFYIHIFFFLINKFRHFFFFLPCKLSNMFNYIIYIRENFSYKDGKRNFFPLLDQIYMNSNNNDQKGHNLNIFYQGNFMDCFVDSLKTIYNEWGSIVSILYNYHIILVLRQYNIMPIKDNQILDLLQKLNTIKILDYIKLKDFVNLKKKKKKSKKYANNFPKREYIHPSSNNDSTMGKKNESYEKNWTDEDKKDTNKISKEDISNFRSLSLIHLSYLINKYLYIWNNLYNFLNYVLSYLLYSININDYIYFNSIYDNAKKFCICYDIIVLYWRNNQIFVNKSMEKIFRFLLNNLNLYYSNHINDWIKRGKINDKYNEFFVYSQNKSLVQKYDHSMLFIKKQNDYVLCPEFFNSFIFFLISLGNNIHLYMKIKNEQNAIDYIDYYIKEEANSAFHQKKKKKYSKNYYYSHALHKQDFYNGSNFDEDKTSTCDTYEDDIILFREQSDSHKKLHENTLDYYYNLENIKKIQNNSLDILSKFLKISKNKNRGLPYFNKNVISLNISYDIFIKKYFQEQFFSFYKKSNRIFLHSIIKYSSLLEYLCCMRSIVFLEINDFISPFFEFIFKDVSSLIIDERKMNYTFRQCVINKVIMNSDKADNKNIYINNEEPLNYTCSYFMHKKFVLLHMKILLSMDNSYYINYFKKMHHNTIFNSQKHKKKSDDLRKKNIPNFFDYVNKIEDPTTQLRDHTDNNRINYMGNDNYDKNGNQLYEGQDQRNQNQLVTQQMNLARHTLLNTNNGEIEANVNNNFYLNSKNGIITNECIQNEASQKNQENVDNNRKNNTYDLEDKICIRNELIKNFYKEDIIINVLKNIYFRLKGNKMYNNNINVITNRNLMIETKGGPFINFLFDSNSLEKYSAILSFFLEIKKSLHILNLVHIFYKYLKTKRAEEALQFHNFHIIITALCILKYKVFFFLNTLYTYYQWILAFAWNNLLLNLYASKSLYHIKNNHELYLNFLLEAMLIPITTEHQELYNYYINKDYKNNSEIYKQFEANFYNFSKENNQQNAIERGTHLSQNNNTNNMQNIGNKIFEENGNAYKGEKGFNNLHKKSLLNELFSNNILNILFIPTQIYEIMSQLSKYFNINFDLNFDNSYDNFEYEREEENDEFENDDDDDEEIDKVRKNIINENYNEKNVNNLNNENNLKYTEKEQGLFYIKNNIKSLLNIFEIHYAEFMMKLNIISFNIEENSFFGPNKNSKLFNHIIRMDKNILKKISILEYMLSFRSFSSDPTHCLP